MPDEMQASLEDQLADQGLLSLDDAIGQYVDGVTEPQVENPSVFAAAGSLFSTLDDTREWVKTLATGALLDADTHCGVHELVVFMNESNVPGAHPADEAFRSFAVVVADYRTG